MLARGPVRLLALTMVGALSLAAAPSETPPSPDQQAARVLQALNRGGQPTRQEFVTGSLRFIILHELGHFLVQEYDIPILAREEDMADTYATFASAPHGRKEELEAPIRFWLIEAERSGKAPITWWQEHSLDHQRAFHIACLLTGYSSDRFAPLLTAFGAPGERIRGCAQVSASTADGWRRTLLPAAGSVIGLQQAVVTYDPAPPALTESKAWLERSKLLESVALEIRRYKLPAWRVELEKRIQQHLQRTGPRDFNRLKQFADVRAASCGRTNAYYVPPRPEGGPFSLAPLSPRRSTLVLCYELVEHVRQMAEGHIAEGRR
jgi:Putative metallopeptidase